MTTPFVRTIQVPLPRAAVLPKTGFVRLPTILTHIPVSKSLFWDKVRKGEFPKPVKLGRVTMWRAEDIQNLVRQIEEGA